MRILLVSQMYPGPEAPTLGTFVEALEHGLTAHGHELARAVVDRRGGPERHAKLLLDTASRALRFKPDVVYAHFLVPAGLWAVLAGRAPVVVTAHGQDVENAHTHAAVRAATRLTVARSTTVIAVSQWLRNRLVAAVPAAAAKIEVIDCGVDTERFRPSDRGAARDRVGWDPAGTGFLCVGSLIERKNVLRLARAVERRDEGELALVGDGPLREALSGRPRIKLVGSRSPDQVADWIAACDVLCQPSLIEPFGLAALEGMASGRTVVGTNVGGHPEFITSAAGVLAEPTDDSSLDDALRRACAFPRPNPAAREAALEHDLRRQVLRIEAVLEQAVRGRRA